MLEMMCLYSLNIRRNFDDSSDSKILCSNNLSSANHHVEALTFLHISYSNDIKSLNMTEISVFLRHICNDHQSIRSI